MDLCSFVAIFTFILSIDYQHYRHMFYSMLGVTKRSNAVTNNESWSNDKTTNGIKIQEVKKKKILIKEKHNNGCNSLITTFTNLESYVYPKKCLKQRRHPPTPPLPPPPLLSPAKLKVFSGQKSHLATAVICS